MKIEYGIQSLFHEKIVLLLISSEDTLIVEIEQCITNGVARTLKKLRTSKGDLIKQLFNFIASLFIIGTSLKGKNLLPEEANSFL